MQKIYDMIYSMAGPFLLRKKSHSVVENKMVPKIAIVGQGVIGTSSALAILERFPDVQVILEQYNTSINPPKIFKITHL